MVRSHVFFSGSVQGVGFRYTTQRFARELKINGWVKNLSDGSVQLVVEGDADRIQDLARYLEDNFRIREKTQARVEAKGSLTEFQIAH